MALTPRDACHTTSLMLTPNSDMLMQNPPSQGPLECQTPSSLIPTKVASVFTHRIETSY